MRCKEFILSFFVADFFGISFRRTQLNISGVKSVTLQRQVLDAPVRGRWTGASAYYLAGHKRLWDMWSCSWSWSWSLDIWSTRVKYTLGDYTEHFLRELDTNKPTQHRVVVSLFIIKAVLSSHQRADKRPYTTQHRVVVSLFIIKAVLSSHQLADKRPYTTQHRVVVSLFIIKAVLSSHQRADKRPYHYITPCMSS
ncbi:hypothetical protein J6590_066843 [Homalodisca vitripennis]|nr:hypothetical protein J6590_066843 [Homalodisca vitripennis]